MIKKIVMKNVASFGSNPVIIDTENHKVCLFYGLNGTGKSTITNYLYDKGKDLPSKKYDNCKTEMDEILINPEIYVYNSQFVEENFYASDSQKGVFSLRENDIKAIKAIEEAEKTLSQFNDKLAQLTTEKNNKEGERQKLTEDIKNKVFKIKQEHDRQALDFCLDGAKTKDGFWTKLENTSINSTKIDIEELKQSAQLLKNPPSPKYLINSLSFEINKIEADSIWSEVIIGSGDSYLKELVNEMNNSSWVKEGSKYLSLSKGKCPFCQQKITDTFVDEITKFFDKTYENKCSKIKSFKEDFIKYQKEIEDVLKNITSVNPEYLASKDLLTTSLNNNYQLICAKEKSPEVKKELEETKLLISKVNTCIQQENEKIQEFNSRFNNPNNEKQRIKTLFWQYVEQTYHDDILKFKTENSTSLESLRKIEDQIKTKGDEIAEINNIVRENNEKIMSLSETLERIKNTISSIGITGFKIIEKTDSKGKFQLIRDEPTDDGNIYKSLSEGEKTLITFLYFLEYCRGTTDKEKSTPITSRIIVIDDPISSLSQNYVYDIASLITKTFIKDTDNGKLLNVNQLLIFTHNLFFFHELCKQKMKIDKVYPLLFRIKKNGYSDITKMNENEIQNDYESFWFLYKECLTNKAPVQIIPNTMRNILEYFFSFIKKTDDLRSILDNLSSEDSYFRPLHRYIDRGSHSDLVNISEFKDIDVNRYKDMFRKIFESAGFLDHYNTMMNIEDP